MFYTKLCTARLFYNGIWQRWFLLTDSKNKERNSAFAGEFQIGNGHLLAQIML